MPDVHDLRNAHQEERNDRLMAAAWRDAERLQYQTGDAEVTLGAIKIKLPGVFGEDFLVVLTGTGPDGGPVVAFVSGETFAGALSSALAKATSGAIKWRVDEWRLQNG